MNEKNVENRVLALKYRPKRFEDLVGQTTISQTLSLALDSSRLSHAYLFSGLRGSGKTSTARIMAKALLCSNGPTSRPCEVCENCQSANTNKHLDIIEMDAASNRGIDDIKDLIEHTKYKPSSARFKVFIIDEVHMLTTQAFNALLKTLEEPPGFVKFILATTDPLKLPATILSRTQHFRFNKIANSDVMHHLSHILNEENIDFETDALEILARTGQGSLRDTLTLLDQAIIFSKGKITTRTVVDMLGLIEPKLMDELFDTILRKQDFTKLVQELENYEISQVCDEMTIYLKQKMLEKDAKFNILLFDRFFRILSDAKHLLAINSDGGFVLILTLSKMVEATNLKTIDEIINQVQDIEVKPIIKDVISKEKVVEHANNDINHAYDDEVVKVNETFMENRKALNEESPIKVEENEVEEAVEIENETTISTDSINAIPTVQPIEVVEQNTNPFPNPFDEEYNMPIEEKQNEVIEEPVENVIPPMEEKQEANQNISPEIPNQTVQEIPNQTVQEMPQETVQEIVEEPIVEEPVYEPIPQVVPEVIDENTKAYKQLIAKVYERDDELGEAFEKNFVYKNFSDNKLEISSYAQGDERKFLLKHYGILKLFIYDIFGENIEIEFIKEETKKSLSNHTQEKNGENLIERMKDKESSIAGIALVNDISLDEAKQVYEAQNSIENGTGSMVEDIEVGSGCVADMQKTANPSPSQKELQLKDILNSSQLNTTKELFHIKKITVKTKT